MDGRSSNNAHLPQCEHMRTRVHAYEDNHCRVGSSSTLRLLWHRYMRLCTISCLGGIVVIIAGRRLEDTQAHASAQCPCDRTHGRRAILRVCS